jgi:uncharacterized protein (DUF433 family)
MRAIVGDEIMQLEDYFEFEKFETPFGPVDRIRLKGHRIAIEHVLELHQQGLRPEKIVSAHFPSLSLEQVYATIAYYLHNQKTIDEYLKRGEEVADAYYQEWLRTKKPGGIGDKLRALRAKAGDQRQESA